MKCINQGREGQPMYKLEQNAIERSASISASAASSSWQPRHWARQESSWDEIILSTGNLCPIFLSSSSWQPRLWARQESSWDEIISSTGNLCPIFFTLKFFFWGFLRWSVAHHTGMPVPICYLQFLIYRLIGGGLSDHGDVWLEHCRGDHKMEYQHIFVSWAICSLFHQIIF